jgi:hypothetical protein
MRIDELLSEGFSQVWARNKSGPVRRYKCTNGPKTGRVVAKPATCNTATPSRVMGMTTKTKKIRHKKSKFNVYSKILKKKKI